MYAYIAVALVIGLLIGFATLAVMWLARAVGVSVRKRTLDLISAYDDLLEERSRELALLTEQARVLQQPVPVSASDTAEKEEAEESGLDRASLLGTVERIASTEYRDRAAVRLYRKIREGFVFSPSEALARMPREQAEPVPGPASQMLEALSFETVFSLSTLPSEEQLRLLQETLQPAQWNLVEQYQTRKKGPFDSLGFYAFLRETAGAEPHPPVLYVAPALQCSGIPPQVQVKEDPSICEGFVLEAGDRIFDYCIKNREIG